MKKQNIIILTVGILLIVLTTLFIVFNNNEKKEDKPEDTKFVETKLLEFGDFKNIKLDKIINVEKIRYTVAGGDRETITDSEEISNLYNLLSKVKLVEETDMACEDNTTIYIFNLDDDTKVSVEFECDWVIVKNKRYIVKTEY